MFVELIPVIAREFVEEGFSKVVVANVVGGSVVYCDVVL